MTELEILEQIELLQHKLALIRGEGESSDHTATFLNEEERERQHQEDLQHLRGLRLIDDDFMNACFDGYNEGAELLLYILQFALEIPDQRDSLDVVGTR